MIYLDNGATSFLKPPQVRMAVQQAMTQCANPGRGGHKPAMAAAKTVFQCRRTAGEMFDCQPEQVVFTANCTHGLNIAIETLVKPGNTVVVSGFEHNAVVRPLYARQAKLRIAGRRLFHPADTLEQFEKALRQGADAAVFTHCSNVFGYMLPVEEMAALCHQYGVAFVVDAAQTAGKIPISLEKLGADFIAMPGHKGLLGPQGTGLLLCNRVPESLMQGGTGSMSESRTMPAELPDAAEAGTLNVPGIAGLNAGMQWVRRTGVEKIHLRETEAVKICIEGLQNMGFTVFSGKNQGGTVSFVGKEDCELLAQKLAQLGIAVRGGLHCAPLAHESAGTLESGTVRVSFGHDASRQQARRFLQTLNEIV